MALFTPEELEELRWADEEIEANFEMTAEDYRLSRKLDREKNGKPKKTYYQRNREHCLAVANSYRRSHREKIAEYKKAYYQKNKAEIKAKSREYYRRNKAEIKVKSREYYRRKKGVSPNEH